MSIVLDIVVILFIILFTYNGAKKGFIKSLADLLGAIIASILAFAFSHYVATLIFDLFVKGGVENRINELVNSYNTDIAVESFFSGLPDFFVGILSSNGITQSSILAGASGSAENISAYILIAVSPVFVTVIQYVVTIILFILFLLIIKSLSSVLTTIFRIPVLKELNALAGGVFGFVFSLIIVWIALFAVDFGSNLISVESGDFVNNTIDNSNFTNFILKINPFANILG